MTDKRFHWDWKTGRMKDTYLSFQATKDMRLIERHINDACQSYEKQIAKLEKENEQLKASLYAEKTNTAEVINNYTKQFKRYSKEFSFMIDLAEDLGVDVSKLEALND